MGLIHISWRFQGTAMIFPELSKCCMSVHGLPRAVVAFHGNAMAMPWVFIALSWGLTALTVLTCHEYCDGIAM